MTDFEQGAYRPLLGAESALAKEDTADAIVSFQVAALRAYRCNRMEVFDRIRNRLGSAGAVRCEASFASAWPLLARYALWSAHFGMGAAKVEDYALSRGHARGVFEYPILLSQDRTVWGDAPERVTLGMYRWLEGMPLGERLLTIFYRSNDFRFPILDGQARVYSLNLGSLPPAPTASLHLREARPSGRTWYADVNYELKWTKVSPDLIAPAGWAVPPGGAFGVDHLMAIGGSAAPPFSVVLRRSYQPLLPTNLQ